MAEATLFLQFNGEPRGKGRPRATIRKSKGGARQWADVFTDEKTRSYEGSVKSIARDYMAARNDVSGPLTGALSVTIRFRLGVPKSTPKWLTAEYLAGSRPYTGGPDVDNMAKAILDGLNEVCFLDDRQIIRLFVTKGAAEVAGVDVRIEALEPQEQP